MKLVCLVCGKFDGRTQAYGCLCQDCLERGDAWEIARVNYTALPSRPIVVKLENIRPAA